MSQHPINPQNSSHPTSGGLERVASGNGATAVGVLAAARATMGRWWRSVCQWTLQSDRLRDLISFQVSLVVHCFLMILLAVMVMREEPEKPVVALFVGTENSSNEALDLVEITFDEATLSEALPAETAQADRMPEATELEVVAPFSQPRETTVTQPSIEIETLDTNDLMLVSEAPTGGGFDGRQTDERLKMARLRGGSAASESAVEMGLQWLAAHQFQNGAWRLDHRDGPCDGRCADPGQKIETPIGATGLALLPFLGAGYTHDQGPYATVMQNGLEFLKKQMKDSPHGGDLHWDTTVGMYSHGIATLALCEAYAMTGDQSLEPYAQKALDFICSAQHKRGGWRYNPGQPGDTTVTGWQVMALKSGRLAHLYVPSKVNDKAKTFLNTVQDGRGAFYGYLGSDKSPGPTSVGLLLRMYLGWTRQDERLKRGVAYLSNRGPSKTDMYYNYYATQVLHHYEGPYWEKWNNELRDYLIETQAKEGHEKGSWFVFDPHGAAGGRHYTTAIATMTLEVYYRYMPLYGERAIDDDF